MHVFTASLVLLIGVCLHAMTASEASDPWTERLEQLDPSRPLEYFELGEEIADVAEAHSAEERLSLELFALAGQLDFKRLGRSSILAIGHFTSNPNQKRRLLDAAELLSDHRLFKPEVAAERGSALQDQVAFGMMLGALRLERWDDARTLLENPGVMALLLEHGDLLGLDPATLALELESGRVSVIGELKRHLLVEWSVHDRSGLDWAVELEVSNGMPLTVIDLGDMETLLGADVKRPYWRNGSWSDSAAFELD